MNTPTSDDKLWAGLSYAGLVCCMVPTIVIFFLKKDESAYIKFNALQAMGLWLANLAIWIIFSILGHIPVIGFVTGIIHMVIGLGLMGYWIFLMIQAFMGKETRIPVLADFIDQNLMG
jgi:uncharacterized membrane protein